MGVHLAGFSSEAVAEWNKKACDTLRHNVSRKFDIVDGWNVIESDVRDIDFSSFEDIDLVAGGPPCQPFSMGGKHKAHCDTRDMFPATAGIVRELRPKAFIVENVKGLTRPSFSDYFEYIRLRLAYPDAIIEENESQEDHLVRLRSIKTSATPYDGTTYDVSHTLINAADYGIPQKRERVFIVGFRSDLSVEWAFPEPTHSFDALMHEQWVSGKYWERHGIPEKDVPSPHEDIAPLLARIKNAKPASLPWKTIRDAIHDLPDPSIEASHRIDGHEFKKGAKTYPGHTGSPIDLPSKTIKAGAHGVPGGENMIVLPDGSVRYFTVREAARIQTFPDGYSFPVPWTEALRQLGNAVPVELARIVAGSVRKSLDEADERSGTTSIPQD